MDEGKTRRRLLTGLGLGALAAGAAVLSRPLVAALGGGNGPPLKGKFGKRFTLQDTPAPVPAVPFKDRAGAEVSLPDFEGRVVLLNFWATWCAPCIEEMPTLDALQQDLGSDRFTVMAVSQDVGGRETVEPFLRNKLDLQALDIYLDPEGRLARALGLRGMPTTYLIDARGRVVGELVGPADWNAPEVKALIRHYIEAAET